MKRLLYVIGVVSVFSVAFAAAGWVGATSRVESKFDLSSPLMARGRDSFSVCVAANEQLTYDALGAAADQLETALTTSLADAKEPTEWVKNTQIVSGCPAPTALTGKPVGKGTTGTVVDSASPHRLFIYQISEQDFRTAFGDKPYGTAPEEFLCEGDTCGEVTTGIYVTKLDLNTLWNGVVDALGLLTLKSAPVTETQTAQ